MKSIMQTRTQEDVDYFFKTNYSIVPAFLPYVNEDKDTLTEIVLSQNYIIHFFKRLINRRRPYQIDTELKPLSTETSEYTSISSRTCLSGFIISFTLIKKISREKGII